MLSQIKNEREGCPLIARTETHSDRERILALLSPRSTDACVRQVFADIDEINRLMEYYSFRTPQLADRFADMLEARYRYHLRPVAPSAPEQRQQLSAARPAPLLAHPRGRSAPLLRGHLFADLRADRQRRRPALPRPSKADGGLSPRD